MEIFGTRLGLTYASQSLRDQIASQGWQVKKVSFDSKRDKYEAVAAHDRHGECRAFGRSERLALSNLLLACTRRTSSTSMRLGRWDVNFADQLGDIAQAYAKAPLYDPKASASFMELAKDCERRAEVLKTHLEIQIVNDPNPYKSPDKLHKDVKSARKLVVSRAGADHPIWSPAQVIAYRICHDVFGYVAADSGWDWYGENAAFAAHAHIIGEEAQKALFTESIATTAYASYYQAFSPEKIAIFPQFVSGAQESNQRPGYPGVHPSQSFPAVAQPSVKHHVGSFPSSDVSEAYIGSQRLGIAMPNQTLIDPNTNWQSGEPPIATDNGLTIAQAYGDPIEADKTIDNARLIDTEWSYMNQNDPGELAVMKQAIVNAFRVVLLSPRKDLRWNAIHYQDIAHVPGDVSDPGYYWNTLEQSRQNWNEARGFDRYSHMPYMKFIPALINLMYQRNPSAGYDAAQKQTAKLLFDWRTEEQEAVEELDAEQPEHKQLPGFQLENKANARLVARLKTYLAEHKPNLDGGMTRAIRKEIKTNPPDYQQFIQATGATVNPDQQSMIEEPPQPEDTQPDKSRYGAFMGNHLKAIASVSRYVDDLLKASLEDVHEHNGAGWHFRAKALSLGIPGVGPKVCSFAWLLLQPMTSQLGTIDTHMMDLLGHTEKEYNNRDYFAMERQLQAGRDAAGYGHVPLGAFQWGMWDYKRTGQGSHQDHSAMRALEPTPHENIDWAAKMQPINAEQAMAAKLNWRTNPPEWWGATQDARDQVWNDWMANEGADTSKKNIPYQNLIPGGPAINPKKSPYPGMLPDDGSDPSVYTSSLKTSVLAPWFAHPETGEQYTGQPGETNMAHLVRVTGLSVPEIWERFSEAGKLSALPPVADPPIVPADLVGSMHTPRGA